MNFMQQMAIFLFALFSFIQGQTSSLSNGQNELGIIQSRKLFLFDAENGFRSQQANQQFSFQFQRQFGVFPRIGLSVYTFDVSYSPDFRFSTFDTNTTGSKLIVESLFAGSINQLFIMYIATDSSKMGIFSTGKIQTLSLTQFSSLPVNQTFTYNFKQIFNSSTPIQNIKLSVYLTGLSMNSELVTNGFPINYAAFSLDARIQDYRFYSLIVSRKQRVQILSIQCSFIYFDPSQMISEAYQMNSNLATLEQFGGKASTQSLTIDLSPLAKDDRFDNLQFFFGIRQIESQDGSAIRLLGVEKYFQDQTISETRILLQMQTWQFTRLRRASYSYIQYKSLRCDLPGSKCADNCSNSPLPKFFNTLGFCFFCHYSCLTCNISQSTTICDTCSPSRILQNSTKLCQCLPTFYDTFNSSSCSSCKPFCQTCIRKNSCLTCQPNTTVVYNPVTTECKCANATFNSLSATAQKPCDPCAQGCLSCRNLTYCQACDFTHFLNSTKTQSICIRRCNQSQIFVQSSLSCNNFNSDLFDAEGRFSFDWDYRLNSIENQIIINLIFSQTDLSFYYFENGTGYKYFEEVNGAQGNLNNVNNGATPNFFYDDGFNTIAGYQSSITTSISALLPSLINVSRSSQQYQSVLRGEYYGMGQADFFKNLYFQENQKNPSPLYENLNQYGIPFGKVELSFAPLILNPNFLDALRRNLKFSIDNDVIPYTIIAKSSNAYQLRAKPQKSYTASDAKLSFNNPALVRVGDVALQQDSVSKQFDRFDLYSIQELNDARQLEKSNSTIVQILWGICKYILFVGFGWFVMPLMLVLQFIMAHNYLNVNLPINLDSFLRSFADFRNPSILFNPERNNFNNDIFSHNEIYKSIPQLEQFDFGLEFMKNCFQFYFTPVLSFILLLLFFLINKGLNILLKKDIPLISKYLVPGALLHAAAYTLVQALPISFFFFVQLKDITYHHPNQPSPVYPAFNTAMAYISLFLTILIPLVLAFVTYRFFNIKVNKAKNVKQLAAKFQKILNSQQIKEQKRSMNENGLWGTDPMRAQSYPYSTIVFYRPILIGLMLGFFITIYPWQITGLILINGLFFGVTFFYKYFKDSQSILLVIYEIIHAGVGSNRSLSTNSQLSIGYLGIGVLYILILIAILFSIYLLFLGITSLYKYFCEKGKFFTQYDPVEKDKDDRQSDQQNNERMKAYQDQAKNGRGAQKLKSRFLVVDYGGGQEVPQSADRFLPTNIAAKNNLVNAGNQKLIFIGQQPKGFKFQLSPSKKTVYIDKKNGLLLSRATDQIIVDKDNEIYSKETYYGNLENLQINSFEENIQNRFTERQLNFRKSKNKIDMDNEFLQIQGVRYRKAPQHGPNYYEDILTQTIRQITPQQLRLYNETATKLSQLSQRSNVKSTKKIKTQTITIPKQIISFNGNNYQVINRNGPNIILANIKNKNDIKTINEDQFQLINMEIRRRQSINDDVLQSKDFRLSQSEQDFNGKMNIKKSVGNSGNLLLQSRTYLNLRNPAQITQNRNKIKTATSIITLPYALRGDEKVQIDQNGTIWVNNKILLQKDKYNEISLSTMKPAPKSKSAIPHSQQVLSVQQRSQENSNIPDFDYDKIYRVVFLPKTFTNENQPYSQKDIIQQYDSVRGYEVLERINQFWDSENIETNVLLIDIEDQSERILLVIQKSND